MELALESGDFTQRCGYATLALKGLKRTVF